MFLDNDLLDLFEMKLLPRNFHEVFARHRTAGETDLTARGESAHCGNLLMYLLTNTLLTATSRNRPTPRPVRY